MPDLPRIFAPPNTPGLNLPRANANMFGAQVFQTAQDAFKQIDDAYTESESRRIQGETAAKINEALALTKQDEQDPDSYYSTVTSKIESIRQDALASANTPRIKSAVDNFISVANSKAQLEATLTRKEKQVEAARGNSVAILGQAKRDMAAASTPEERNRIEASVATHLQAMQRAGVYAPKEIAKMGEDFLTGSDKERMTQVILNAPDKAESYFTVQNFPYLNNEEILAGKTRAKERANYLDEQKKKAEKEQLDNINGALLKETEAAGANLTGLREAILQRNDLPFEAKKFWVDRLNHAIKADEKGEADPFRKSDSATLGRVFKTILENPDQISATDISGMIGQGLSVSDALRATTLLANRTKQAGGKELPTAMDPLNLAFKTWEKLRDQYTFVNPADPKNMTAEELSKNQARAVEVWQGVLDTMNANPGANPQDTLNALMKPFYSETVRNWFTLGLTTKQQQPGEAQLQQSADVIRQRGAAINELKKRGLPVTDSNVAKVLDYLGQAKNLGNKADQEKARQKSEMDKVNSGYYSGAPGVKYDFKDANGNVRPPTPAEKAAIDKYMATQKGK